MNSSYLAGLASAARERSERLAARVQVNFLSPVARPAPPRLSPPTHGGPAAFLNFSGEGEHPGELPRVAPPLRDAGGVGVADLTAFVMSRDFAQGFCLGEVSGGPKFCVLGKDTCTIKKHKVKKVKVFVNHLYISGGKGPGKNSAFSYHHADVSSLTQVQLENVLLERHSADSWARLLHGLNLSLGVKVASVSPPEQLSALTPFKKRKVDYESIESGDSPPSLKSVSSDESDGLVILTGNSGEDLSPEEKLGAMASQWEAVLSTVNLLGSQFKRLKQFVSMELDSADVKMTGVDARIGCPDREGPFEDCISAWDGLMAVHSAIEELGQVCANLMKQSTDAEVAVSERVDTVAAEFTANASETKRSLEELGEVVKYLNDEQALLGDQSNLNSGAVSEGAFVSLRVAVQQLRDDFTMAERKAGIDSMSIAPPRSVDPAIGALKLQMSILESRIPLDAVMAIGGQLFKSKGEVMMFVEKEMPPNLYYLCHDPVTLLENIAGLHVERTSIVSELYQADRIGMTAAEARHCASFQITLPSVFGYVKEGGSTKYPLPAVKTYQEWNPTDGTSGVRGYIVAGLADLNLQVRQEIEDTFDAGNFKAKALARDMHDFSQSFLAQMMNFGEEFYHELINHSKSKPDEAYELLAAIYRRIFDEMRKVRTSASYASRDKNPISKCTSYIWAMIQAHRVMKDLLDAKFRNHVMIAPVIILHVFKTRITRVAHDEAIKRLEGRIAALEKDKGSSNKKVAFEDKGVKK